MKPRTRRLTTASRNHRSRCQQTWLLIANLLPIKCTSKCLFALLDSDFDYLLPGMSQDYLPKPPGSPYIVNHFWLPLWLVTVAQNTNSWNQFLTLFGSYILLCVDSVYPKYMHLPMYGDIVVACCRVVFLSITHSVSGFAKYSPPNHPQLYSPGRQAVHLRHSAVFRQTRSSRLGGKACLECN